MFCSSRSSWRLGTVFVLLVFVCGSGYTAPPSYYYLKCKPNPSEIDPSSHQYHPLMMSCGSRPEGCVCPPQYITDVYLYTSNPPFKTRFRRHPSARPTQAITGEAAKRPSRPQAAADPTYTFTHTLQDGWDDVVGYVGFRYTDPSDQQEYIACLIGLYVEPQGNGIYKSEEWDKKIFWIEVGDGAPMPVCAIYAPNYEEDDVEYDNVYWAPNFMYLPPGGQDPSQIRPCELWMFLDEEDEVEEVWIDIFNEDWEVEESKLLEIGDQIKPFTPLIDPDEPSSFLGVSLENRFQTVKEPPVFIYEHMTPNVDFIYEQSTEAVKKFDFNNVDLLFILYGESETEEGVIHFNYSTPKNVNLKWGDAPATTENWFLHEMSSAFRFLLPDR